MSISAEQGGEWEVNLPYRKGASVAYLEGWGLSERKTFMKYLDTVKVRAIAPGSSKAAVPTPMKDFMET